MKDCKQLWWKEAKFGMFIHWGLYALLAGEYNGRKTGNIAEWIMHDLKIPVKEYEKLAARFNPTDFSAQRIVTLAKNTGMRYIVITSKHHDGFAMYKSQCSRYNIVDATPFGRDPIRELAEECARQDIKLCFYYSQAQDWHDPNGFEEDTDNAGKDFRKYLDEKCIPQLRELLTQYGDIGLIWFDTPMGISYEQSKELKELVHSIQPNCIVSGRIGNDLGDYMSTGDNFIPLLPYEGDWEVPATINNTWGYKKHDLRWKSADKLLRNLVKIVSRGGNYLLNIGPDGMGNVPEESVRVLEQIGEFMRLNGESIYGAQPTPMYPYDIDWGYFTCRKGKIYIHVFDDVEDVYILNIANTPLRAYILADHTPLQVITRTTCEGDPSWRIAWPEQRMKQIDTVICVEIAEDAPIFEPIR